MAPKRPEETFILQELGLCMRYFGVPFNGKAYDRRAPPA